MAQESLWGASHSTLRSIRITNFRLFRDLSIPRLGLVNLLVGRNNTGKSSVLEAVRLLASEGAPRVLGDILDRREEGLGGGRAEDLSVLYLLSRRDSQLDSGFEVSSGTEFLRVKPRLLRRSKDDDIEAKYEDVGQGEVMGGAEWYVELTSKQRRRIIPMKESLRTLRLPNRYRDTGDGRCVFVGTSGLSRQEFASYWAAVALTELEDRVNRCMRDSFSEVERISVVPADRDSSIVAKIRGTERPVALKSLGEGANRFFGLALAIANARNGVLLIDEVEIGIHFSIQVELWRLLIQLANEFNVQIFATTHSEDAIRAFSIATSERESVAGCLIRLQSRNGEIEVVEYDEAELLGARGSGMEIR